jgi:hypothetical protein
MSETRGAEADDGEGVTFRPTRTGLRATATGPGTYAATVACWEAILVQVQERRPETILLIDEMRGPSLHAEEWHGLVDAMRGKGLENVRIAHVKPMGLQGIEYCEIFAREAGFHARVFDNEATAERWLRYGSQPEHGDGP